MNSSTHNILFLYTEIAPYFMACCNTLAKKHGVKIHVIRYPINNEAPFLITETNKDVVLYNHKNYSAGQLIAFVKNLNPSVIICSGWTDKEYLKICKIFFGKISTVLTMDTHWRGDLKQQIASVFGPVYFRKRFSHCWVPGNIQKKYALKLGFKEEQISLGFYSADKDYFSSLYNTIIEEKKKHFPKRFIYVGRYYEFKGIVNLWNAFAELQNENPNEWELWCLGTGTVEPVTHPKIKHFGFVQPENLPEYVKNSGVFVMPSLFEPWGVVLQEFALMGFPLVVSDRVGAAEVFVKDKINGFLYEATELNSLKEKLKICMELTSEKLTLMGEESRKQAFQITPDKWADTVMKFL